MPNARRSGRLCWVATCVIVAALGTRGRAQDPVPGRAVGHDPFAQFTLPDAWETRFWADPAAHRLLELDPKAVADLVPVQAGVRDCRCPGCEADAGIDASAAADTLAWSVLKPQVLTCRRCGLTVPNDDVPARHDKQVPEETVEVLPRVVHHYPYHQVEPEKQRHPDERLYLAAKRDYEARAFLARAALYAAVRHHELPPDRRTPDLPRLAAVLVLRFAQVYPAYATHYDQPGEPKYFQQANLPPPYRRGYRTGKWDSTANLDVPMNLVIAYALIRNDPALAEAGRLLGDPNPARTIEDDLFRASAEFVRLQPEEFGEMSLHAYRGLLAVGRLLGDPALVREAQRRLAAFAERGFYHDGLWRQADATAHRRVVGLFDGWIDRLAEEGAPGEVPMLRLARGAQAVTLGDGRGPEVVRAGWPASGTGEVPRHPALLGGAGLARLAVGRDDNALDVELRGLDAHGGEHFQRQAIRLSVGGRPVLGDLDDLPPTASGWNRATASHNTVVVDGLNQRESIALARGPAPGGDFLEFAAEPDFQVVTLEDRHAYPQSTTRYRQTVIAVASGRTRYAVSIFEVHGGLQHDQVVHAAAGLGPGVPASWQLAAAPAPAPATLLPPSIRFVPGTRAEEGRWFVQAYGEFAVLDQARLERPATGWLTTPDGAAAGVRLHLLGDFPLTAYRVASPDPTAGTAREPGQTGDGGGTRAGLILRRRSETGATLKTTFVTVFEPLAGAMPPLVRVGRVASPAGAIVLYLETADGDEHLVVDTGDAPGKAQDLALAGGGAIRTDGRVVWVTPRDLVLAGGTFAETGGRRTVQKAVAGSIVAVNRGETGAGRGWFLTDRPVPDADQLVGRTLLIRHGDGTTHGWTLTRVENSPDGRGARLHTHEEPGFLIDPESGDARYYQFPRGVAPGPHAFHVSRIARASRTGPLPAGRRSGPTTGGL
jgi:hypothetical protein